MALFVDIEKTLGSFCLKVSFEAEEGVLALLGASGCGKSMTLKCIAGIEKPDRGHIELDGRVLFDSERHINLPPQQRRVGYLFQQYALFPNMTVAQNIGCGVRDKTQRTQAVRDIIAQLQLTGLEGRKPSQLSGGQQQRVALARILVNEPEVLLLDEPFSALDSHLRFALERQLLETLRGFGKPVLLVSHDRDEAYRLASRIAVMKAGGIEAFGEKHDLFADPKTVSGARLTGCKNLSPIHALGENQVFAEAWGIPLTVASSAEGCTHIGIRLHDLRLCFDGSAPNTFLCRVEEEIENPFSFTIMLRPVGAEGTELFGIQMNKTLWGKNRGEEIRVSLPPEAILLLRD